MFYVLTCFKIWWKLSERIFLFFFFFFFFFAPQNILDYKYKCFSWKNLKKKLLLHIHIYINIHICSLQYCKKTHQCNCFYEITCSPYEQKIFMNNTKLMKRKIINIYSSGRYSPHKLMSQISACSDFSVIN